MTRARLLFAAAIAIGLALGLGAFTFVYAKGYSYMTNDPAACANCHIMSEHFSAWQKGSHKTVATCNDCHTPHNLLGKYMVKAQNGFWHSFYFTTGKYPDPLRITPRNREVTEGACRYCHEQMVAAIDPLPSGARNAPRDSAGRPIPVAVSSAHADQEASCIRCHEYVGHMVR
jgi:cytochrome c nitrite reductase small subunit